MHLAFAHMKSAAQGVLRPVYLRDLEVHDRVALEARPDCSFAWAVGPDGTHIVWAGDDPTLEDLNRSRLTHEELCAVVDQCGEHEWFTWDGQAFLPAVDAADAAEHLA